MPGVLLEEKKHYGIDCSAALWASDEMHDIYHKCGLPHILCDADFAIETSDTILLVEYKNANIPEAIAHKDKTEEYNPFNNDKFDKIVCKYYDSLHYLHLMGKSKPIRYIFVLEYPKGDSTSRRMLRNRLQKRLPFRLQDIVNTGIKLIESVDVLNISEWNAHDAYGQFPIRPVAQQGT